MTGRQSPIDSIPETARRIGLHCDTLYRLCRTGQFPPAIQIGARGECRCRASSDICTTMQQKVVNPRVVFRLSDLETRSILK